MAVVVVFKIRRHHFDYLARLKRKMILINFPNVFSGNNIDQNLFSKLTNPEEKSGLLNIAPAAIKRLKSYFEHTHIVEKCQGKYPFNSDLVSSFVESTSSDIEPLLILV
jgi:hypothetical protein